MLIGFTRALSGQPSMGGGSGGGRPNIYLGTAIHTTVDHRPQPLTVEPEFCGRLIGLDFKVSKYKSPTPTPSQTARSGN